MHPIILNLQKKAKQGDFSALEKLAWCFDQGKYCKKSYKKAFKYYTLAAKKTKNPIIFYNLSLYYLLGQGTSKDYQKAFEIIKKAAKKEYLDAYIALAWHYYNGFGTTKNLTLAIKYYKKAQNIENNAASLFSLGEIYYDKKDFLQAKVYLEKAVEEFQHAKAAYFLGRIYFEGKAIERNFKKAKKLLTFAMKNNIYNAKRLLNSKKFKSKF